MTSSDEKTWRERLTVKGRAGRRAPLGATASAIAAASIIALQVAGKATRDAVFLGAHPAEALPSAMLAASLASIVAALVVSAWMVRRGPQQVAPALLGLGTLGFLGLALSEPHAPQAVAWALFVHVGVTGPLAVSAFWSVISEAYDPRGARRAIGRIAGGAATGGVVGGLLAEGAAAWWGAAGLLPMVAGLGALTTLILASQGGRARAPSPEDRADASKGDYLRAILALVVILSMAGTLLDLAMKVRVDQLLPASALPSLFARFYAALGLLTFGLQWLVAGRLVRRTGPAMALAVLPLCLLFGAGGALLFAGALPTLIARGSASVCESSLFRSGYELLYAPLSPSRKRGFKILVDVGATRAGDALASALLLGASLLCGLALDRVGLALAAVLAAAALGLVRRIRRHHRALLGERRASREVVAESVFGSLTSLEAPKG